jgi:IS1 family transposase
MQIEYKQLYTWRETIHKKYRTHKIESKTYKTRKQHKMYKLRNIKQLIGT